MKRAEKSMSEDERKELNEKWIFQLYIVESQQDSMDS